MAPEFLQTTIFLRHLACIVNTGGAPAPAAGRPASLAHGHWQTGHRKQPQLSAQHTQPPSNKPATCHRRNYWPPFPVPANHDLIPRRPPPQRRHTHHQPRRLLAALSQTNLGIATNVALRPTFRQTPQPFAILALASASPLLDLHYFKGTGPYSPIATSLGSKWPLLRHHLLYATITPSLTIFVVKRATNPWQRLLRACSTRQQANQIAPSPAKIAVQLASLFTFTLAAPCQHRSASN